MKSRKPSDPRSWFFQAAIHGVTPELLKRPWRRTRMWTKSIKRDFGMGVRTAANLLPTSSCGIELTFITLNAS